MSKIYRWRKEGVEKQLLEVAERLAMTRGPGKISLALVARAAGVSRATAYNYFGDQRGLLSKLVSHRFQELMEVLESALQRQSQDPRAQLETLIREVAGFFERYHRFFRIMVQERADAVLGGTRDGLTAEISNGMDQYVERLTIPLKAGMKRGLFVGQDPKRMAWAIAGMIAHAVLRILQDPKASTRSAEIKIMESIIFHAVLAEPSRGFRKRMAQGGRKIPRS